MTVKKPSSKRTLGFIIKRETEYEITRVYAELVYLAELSDAYGNEDEVGKIYTPRFDGGNEASQYGGFRVSVGIDGQSLYGAKYEYFHYTGVEMDEVLSMARVMRRIERERAKRELHWWWGNFAEQVFDIADILGVTFYAYREQARGPLTQTDRDGIKPVIAALLP